MYQFSSKSLERLSTVNPLLQDIMKEAIKVSPIDFGIPLYGGLRTAKQQNQLFKDGKSKCDGIKIKSYHQSGNAVDVYAYVNGHASWDDVHLGIIAGVVLSVADRKGVNLRWGGTFESNEFHGWDKPHFEIKKGSQVLEARMSQYFNS